MILKVRGLIVVFDGQNINMAQEKNLQIQEKFGANLRELRKQKKLSQEALAFACALDRTYIGGVERGERNISLVNIYKIASALGVDVKELFND